MESENLGITGGSNSRLQTLYIEEHPGHNQTTGTTKKIYFFAILAIVGFGGLVVGVVGLVQAVQAGAFTNHAIIMLATGEAGRTLLLIIGIVGLVKNRQIGNQPIEPLERTIIEGVENFTVFGAREWQRFYGDVGVQPDYPEGIVDILNAPCPFSQNENIKVKDSHMLVLVPATVGGEALNLNRLKELIQHPNNNGHVTNCDYYSNAVRGAHGNTESGRSYWVLMTKEVIPGSRNKTYNEQIELVRRHERLGYTLPRALEAAVCILMEHVVSGNKLFGTNPLTYTRCSEVVQEQYAVVVGGFDSVGLGVIIISFLDNSNDGVGALRKF